MLSQIRDIMVISTPKDLPHFKKLLEDGGKLGLNINYAEQKEPKGLAEAYLIGEDFLNDSPSCLILGDNLFYGGVFSSLLVEANKQTKSTIFTYQVSEPSKYGILSLDKYDNPISVEEKPENPKSNLAITGLYFFDNKAPMIAKEVKPSYRGELEITEIISHYINGKSLINKKLSRGIAWLDTGTAETLCLVRSKLINSISVPINFSILIK